MKANGNSGKKNFKMSVILFSCAGVLLALMITLCAVFPMYEPIIALLFSSTAMDSATRASGEALATQIVEEGVVMVENNDEVLPLDKDEDKNVAVLGWASTQWVMGGSGSGRSTNNGKLTPNTTFLGALKAAGITYNTAITDYYTTFCKERPFYTVGSGGGALNVHDYEYCRLIEPNVDSYKDKLDAAAAETDVALVVISRISGESIDCPMAQYKNYTGKGKAASSGALEGAAVDTSRTYLDVSTEEEKLLEYAAENFDRVIVLINNTNAMNLNFLKTIDGLDACIIAGGTGNNSVDGLINVMYGEQVLTTFVDTTDEKNPKTSVIPYTGEQILVSPSGKTVDTYVYDFKTNPGFVYTAMEGVSLYKDLAYGQAYPAMNNITNGNVNQSDSNERYEGVSYLDYVEGIYVGYKWYETADAEGYWDDVDNEYGKGYNGVVQYPFGYGLSYAQFDWIVKGWEKTDTTISVTVVVENKTDFPAQEVVELYYTPKYEKGGLEKAAVNLCAFAKTATPVEKGHPQELTLSFDIQDMASYDQDRDGGKYVLEDGTYEISLRTDSHNIVRTAGGSATYKYTVGSDVVYDSYNGSNGTEKIHNLFTGDGISDKVAIDGSNTNQNIKWLSRENFEETFPKVKAEARSWNTSDLLQKTNLFTRELSDEWEKAHADEAPITTDAKNNITVYDGKKVNSVGLTYGNPENYDNKEMWDKLLDQLSINEMTQLVLHAYVHEEALPSIGKPQTAAVDGPSQIGSFNQSNAGVGYPMPTLLGQSWNAELSKSYGLAVGKETKDTNRDGWYAPGVNLHRSAFGGRNYEYYSEDPVHSGIMCAQTVRGALNAGVYTYIKHFIGYDQESMRDGLYCWLTEQTLRETYLRPYKIAVDEGATGVMSSYGRLGAVWSGGSEALLVDLLRDEWGFKGTVLTDYSDHHDFMSGDHMIRGGGDIWMDWYTQDSGAGRFRYPTGSNAFNQRLRGAAKHVVYMCLNAAYEEQAYVDYVNENGGIDGVTITTSSTQDVFAWWWLVFGIIDALLVAGAAACAFFGVKKLRESKSDVHLVTENSEE